MGPGPPQMHQVQNNLGSNWNIPVVSVPNIQPQQPPSASIPAIANLNAVNVAREMDSIVVQQKSLRDQIRQSEQNLTAQHGVIHSFCPFFFFYFHLIGSNDNLCEPIHWQVLMQQQQKQIEEAVEKVQWETVLKQAEDNGLRLTDFDTILQPIIDSCTKDSISAGKWTDPSNRIYRFPKIYYFFRY